MMSRDIFLAICVFWSFPTFVRTCFFSEPLKGSTWYTNIRTTTKTAINFRVGVMEYEDIDIKLGYVTRQYEDVCVKSLENDKFLVRHENKTYSCIKFVQRGDSVYQLRTSTVSTDHTAALCQDSNLKIYPWLLINYDRMMEEFTTCPFSGGYNMKIKDSSGSDHACNFNDLSMRLESECLSGEGITFNFRSPHCIDPLPMSIIQRALCVTHWRSDGDVISVLRNSDSDQILCLRIPARKSYTGKTTMLLFTSAQCDSTSETKYFQLELELVAQNTLCVDDHANCDRLPCAHFKTQCMRTCELCDPNVYPTACDFPRKYRGNWHMSDSLGTTAVNISTSRLQVDRIGHFECITFPDSPPRRTKQFTTLSFFNNGCRPRYTCVSMTTLNSNIPGIALSQSRVWPFEEGFGKVGTVLCDSSNFHADYKPLRDLFRSYNDVYKPILSATKALTLSECPFKTNVHFNATFSNGKICNGHLATLCHDHTSLRMRFEDCPGEREVTDFQCIGQIEGKYYEEIIMLKSYGDPLDTRCLVSSEVDKTRMIMLPSGECDKYSWIRKPSVDLTVTPDSERCLTLTTANAITSPKSKPFNDRWQALDMNDGSFKSGIDNKSIYVVHKHRHHKVHPITTQQPYHVIHDDSRESVTHNSASSINSLYSFCYSFSITVLLCVFS